MLPYRRMAMALVGVVAIATGGCQGYVKKADVEAALDELRANDEWQQQEIDELWQRMQKSLTVYPVNLVCAQSSPDYLPPISNVRMASKPDKDTGSLHRRGFATPMAPWQERAWPQAAAVISAKKPR